MEKAAFDPLVEPSASPESVVTRLYELISGPAGHERKWDEVRSLFHGDALLHSELALPDGTHQSGTWTVDEFCDAAASEYRDHGLWEREIAVRSERFGNIAHVWSTYESFVGARDTAPVGRGINSVQLLRRDGEWRIASLIFQIERGTAGIPERYHGDGEYCGDRRLPSTAVAPRPAPGE